MVYLLDMLGSMDVPVVFDGVRSRSLDSKLGDRERLISV